MHPDGGITVTSRAARMTARSFEGAAATVSARRERSAGHDGVVSAPSGSALPIRLRALIGEDAEGNPYLQMMRYAAVASLVAGLLLLVSGVSAGNTTLVVLAVVALLWTGMIQVGWWVVCALVWERAQD